MQSSGTGETRKTTANQAQGLLEYGGAFCETSHRVTRAGDAIVSLLESFVVIVLRAIFCTASGTRRHRMAFRSPVSFQISPSLVRRNMS